MKKFKYKPLKAVAFLLCLTLVGVGALSTCRLADFAYRSGFYFGSNSGIADAANNFYDARLSKAFLDEVGFVYYAAKRVFITYRNGEVFQDGSLENELEQAYATYSQENAAEQFQKARSVAEEFNKFYRRLPSETELIAADGYEDRDGDGTRRDDVRDENGRCLNDFENSDQYLVKTNRVTVNTRYFSALVDRSRAADIPGEVAAARAEYEYLTQYLQSLSAVKYLILNDKTGEAFTNSPTMSAYQFNELYGASDWCVSSTDNFETATVSEEFSALCSRMEADDKGAGDVFTINGAEVNGGAYTRQFLESMRYGYESKTKTVSAVLGATVASRRLGGTPCTVYLSYNDSRVTAADPFDALNKDFLASANRFSKSMATLLLSLFISAALTALLCLLTGRDDKNSPIRMRRFDRFPSDLRLVLAAGVRRCGAAGLPHVPFAQHQKQLAVFPYGDRLPVPVHPAGRQPPHRQQLRFAGRHEAPVQGRRAVLCRRHGGLAAAAAPCGCAAPLLCHLPAAAALWQHSAGVHHAALLLRQVAR